ncbi:hypothetical protein [Antarcticirhabdus aurantiaca]|uniref:Uncharacterized protein n=1 Tax=Antarcticirhabdus aurantiaca TaxID=2606717 RepID=A0ACD4NRA3_9HYPH|nr:hypothetical protein OXU80_04305 [Jeongeuplla avenae]
MEADPVTPPRADVVRLLPSHVSSENPMHLVQILLPTADNDGLPFLTERFETLRSELTDRFGGVTVFAQGPAEGFWKGDDGTDRDQIVIFEVMAEEVDGGWWSALRERLEREFRQDEIVIRVQVILRL